MLILLSFAVSQRTAAKWQRLLRPPPLPRASNPGYPVSQLPVGHEFFWPLALTVWRGYSLARGQLACLITLTTPHPAECLNAVVAVPVRGGRRTLYWQPARAAWGTEQPIRKALCRAADGRHIEASATPTILPTLPAQPLVLLRKAAWKHASEHNKKGRQRWRIARSPLYY